MTTPRDVCLFIPNLIGYGRVLATLSSFILMVIHPEEWFLAVSLYIASFVGDLFDGMAARKFNQSSSFGGLLDMITDRCATLGLLFVLMGEYGVPGFTEYTNFYKLLFLFLAILDISSHWCQMYSTAALNLHHKSKEGNQGRFVLVQWYYDIYLFFGYCCVAAELSYVCLYVLAHADPNTDTLTYTICDILLRICVPGLIIKNIVNIFQLTSSCYAVAENDAKLRNEKNQ